MPENPYPSGPQQNVVPRRPLGVIYLVEREPHGSRWNISRDGKPIGGFTLDRNTAVRIAYEAALREEPAANVSVWSFQDGRPRREWPADA